DPQQDWLTNAEAEHSRKPVHAILAKANTNRRDFVLEGDSLDETHSLWRVPKFPVPRVAQEMAACVAPLLRVSKEILFIDPHFGPEKLRYRRPLEAFLAAILEGRDGGLLVRVEIHTSEEPAADFFESECQQKLPNIIPEGMSVRLVRWRQKEKGDLLHNRFILTNL